MLNYLLSQYQAALTLANARLLTAKATLNHRFNMYAFDGHGHNGHTEAHH